MGPHWPAPLCTHLSDAWQPLYSEILTTSQPDIERERSKEPVTVRDDWGANWISQSQLGMIGWSDWKRQVKTLAGTSGNPYSCQKHHGIFFMSQDLDSTSHPMAGLSYSTVSPWLDCPGTEIFGQEEEECHLWYWPQTHTTCRSHSSHTSSPLPEASQIFHQGTWPISRQFSCRYSALIHTNHFQSESISQYQTFTGPHSCRNLLTSIFCKKKRDKKYPVEPEGGSVHRHFPWKSSAERTKDFRPTPSTVHESIECLEVGGTNVIEDQGIKKCNI